MQIRASLKLVKLAYMITLLLAVAIAVYLLAMRPEDDRMWFLLAIPALLALFALSRHIQRRLVTLTINRGSPAL